MKTPRILCAAVVAAVSAITLSCSAQPTDTEVRRTLETLVARESSGAFSLNRFAKLKQETGSEEGRDFAAISYRAEMTSATAGIWRAGPMSADQTFRIAVPPDFSSAGGRVAQLTAERQWRDRNPGGPVRAGAKITIIGTFTFVRAGSSWSVARHRWEPYSGPDPWILPSTSEAAPKSPAAAPTAPVSESVRRQVQANLRGLQSAALQYFLQNGTSSATYADLVGETKFILRVTPIAGEDYTTIRIEQDKPVTIVMPSGERISSP